MQNLHFVLVFTCIKEIKDLEKVQSSLLKSESDNY